MPTKPSTALDLAIHAWTLQALVASRFLGEFYRAMGDGAQAAAALRAGLPASERMGRTAFHGDLRALVDAFKQRHADDTLAEEAAWQGLITALAGMSVFLAAVDEGPDGPGRGLRGLRSANARALDSALKGYRSGFPDAMATQGTQAAIQDAAAQCAEILVGEAETEPQARAALVAASRATLLEGLRLSSGAYL